MTGLKLIITRFVDAHFPGFVECTLTDVFGNVCTFMDKVPMVTEADLDAGSQYPQAGIVACRIISRRVDHDGLEVVIVDTSSPWGIESTTGQTRFEVRPEQVTDFEWAGEQAPRPTVSRQFNG